MSRCDRRPWARPLLLGLGAAALLGACGRVGFEEAGGDGERAADSAAGTGDARGGDGPGAFDGANAGDGAPIDARVICTPQTSCQAFACGGTCYERCPSADWAGARSFCESWAGALAVIDDAAEDACVRANLPSGGQETWIGLSQDAGGAEPGGGWRWVSGAIPSYTNWAAGEPNDAGGIEDCALYASGGGAWADADCTRGAGLLCEM